MIAATMTSDLGAQAKFNRLWIGEEEVPVNGRSIPQCVEEMIQQGWDLALSRANPNAFGILREYAFQRPKQR